MGSRHLPATVLALVIALGAVATDPPPARAAEDQLRDSAVTTYELQPSRGVIHVTVSYTLTNKAPSKSKRYPCTGVGFDPWYGYYTYATTCTRRTDYYYFSYWVWVEKDARAVKVKGSSGTASVKLGKVDGNWRKATMKFSPLWYGKTRKLTLSYDLPAGGARSDADRRVGYVHSAFCAYGPSAERGELRIVAPAGYAFTPSLAMTSSSSGGKVVLASGTLKSKPWTFGGCVRGYNSDGFDTTTLETTGGRAVTVEAWRDDSTWAANVRDATEALSALEAFLGTDGLSPALTIREVLGNGQPNGDPAVYNPLAGTLNVSESLIDRATMVDELTGTWFDKTVFPAGWLRYGYIRWAEHEAGVLDASCDEPGPKPGGGALDLSLWGYYRGLTDELVAYKLQAACWIVRQVNSAIGPAGVEATLTAIREGRDAFSSADAMSDRNAKLLMWRDWLDIVTERGLIPAGADPDLAADLLVEYGVTPDRDEMTAHGAARDAYHALRDLAGGPVPAFITDALARWDFETAQSAIDAATEAWTTAGSVEGVLPGVEADGGPIQDAVLGSESQDELAAAVTLAGAQRSAAEDVADALAVLAAPRDAIQELGLAGTTLPDGAAAIQAVEDVDADRAAAEADAIRAVIGAARDTGTQRAALIGGGIALVLVLAVVVAVIARRHRGRAAPPSEAA